MGKKQQPENLFAYYADSNRQREVAAMLTTLGAQIFKSALIIKEIETIQKINADLDSGALKVADSGIERFVFEHLVDSIRVLVFFENYMKAELIVNDFCVHIIDTGIKEFNELASFQKERPIKLREIQNIEPFEINKNNQTIYHRAIKRTTLPFSIITRKDYTPFYKFDNSVLEFIKELALYRNKLHLNHTLNFSLSQERIEKFKALDKFVNCLFANHFQGS